MRPCKFSIPYFPDQILVKTKQIKKLKTSLIDRFQIIIGLVIRTIVVNIIVVVTVINMVIISLKLFASLAKKMWQRDQESQHISQTWFFFWTLKNERILFLGGKDMESLSINNMIRSVWFQAKNYFAYKVLQSPRYAAYDTCPTLSQSK